MRQNTRICNDCRLEKNLSEFGKTSASLNGHVAICKQCRRDWYKAYNTGTRSLRAKYASEYYKANAERIKKYASARKKGLDTTPYLKRTPEMIEINKRKHDSKFLMRRYREKGWYDRGVTKEFTHENFDKMIDEQDNKLLPVWKWSW